MVARAVAIVCVEDREGLLSAPIHPFGGRVALGGLRGIVSPRIAHTSITLLV
jgi:hypothetical protein